MNDEDLDYSPVPTQPIKRFTVKARIREVRMMNNPSSKGLSDKIQAKLFDFSDEIDGFEADEYERENGLRFVYCNLCSVNTNTFEVFVIGNHGYYLCNECTAAIRK